MSLTTFPAIALDANGLPKRHWSGRVEAAKVLRTHINTFTQAYLSQDDATDVAEEMLRAYLREQR